MKLLQSYILSLLLPFLLLTSCTEKEISPSTDNQFHVYRAQAYIQVRVRGNTASRKILLFVQGGPGSNSLDFAQVDFPEWKNTLEKEFAVAYYDQRGMGNRQGTFAMDEVTTQDWLEDLHAVAAVLKQKYNAQIYLMGHSYGGYLTLRYMQYYGAKGIPARYINISGPATTDGDSTMRWQFRHAFLENIAEEELADLQAGWQPVLEWLQAHTVLDTEEEQTQWNKYVEDKVSSRFDDKLPGVSDYVSVLLFSSYNAPSTFLNSKAISAIEENLLNEGKAFKLADKLSEIQAPLLVITGRYDDIMPPEEVSYLMEHLGSSVRQSVIIPQAGHDVYLHQPNKVFEAIREFIH